jgi:hypothetical protein
MLDPSLTPLLNIDLLGLNQARLFLVTNGSVVSFIVQYENGTKEISVDDAQAQAIMTMRAANISGHQRQP